MKNRLSGKIAIVTGASSGIGKALAENLLTKGVKVALCARDYNRLAAAFPDADTNCIFLKAVDVSKESECAAFVTEILQQWGGIDILINNAGMSMRALFEYVNLDVIRNLMDINFWGTVYMTKYALPSVKQRKGSIVGISSIAGYRGLPARTGYSSSKFAMNGFLESLRTELLKDGVHVMVASPGFTASNIRNTSMTADGSAQKETPLDEGKLMPAEQCAAIIINGIAARKRTLVMTAQGKLTVFLNKLLPGFMDGMVYKHFRKEPDSPLK